MNCPSSYPDPCNGFFAGAELAVLSPAKAISRAWPQPAIPGPPRRADPENPHRFLATVQIGVTVVGSFASPSAAPQPSGTSNPCSWLPRRVYPACGRTPFHHPRGLGDFLPFLVLGELAPKTIGLQYADRIALVVARPIHILSIIAVVAVRFLTFPTGPSFRFFGSGRKRDTPS